MGFCVIGVLDFLNGSIQERLVFCLDIISPQGLRFEPECKSIMLRVHKIDSRPTQPLVLTLLIHI